LALRPRQHKETIDVAHSQSSHHDGADGARATGITSRQFSTFFLHNLYLGVEVLKVQELIRFQDMTRVPLASRVVRGLINLRGQIVTAIDLRRQFDMPELAEGRVPMNVVVRTDEGAVSLLVDEIGDVVEVDEQQFERAPDTIAGRARDLVTGVYKLDGRLLLVLDVHQAVSTERAAAVGPIAA
jgi:purine-binding chemotaxis protein CheW